MRCLSKYVIDGSAVLGSELLRDPCQSSHSLSPVLNFLSRTWILFLVLFTALSLLQSCLDFFTPIIEDSLKVIKHFWVWSLVRLDVFNISVPSGIIWLQNQVDLETLECLLQLIGELVEHLGEFFLLFIFTYTPISCLKLIH